ncbi:MAG: GNAT family N-acetyltransferase [Mycobacterium sp.]
MTTAAAISPLEAPHPAAAIVAVDPRDDVRWDVLASDAGSLFTSSPWIRAVSESYGFAPQARVALDAEGIPRSGFAWVEIEDIRGERLVSLPFSDRAEPILSDPSIWPLLAEDAFSGDVSMTVRCLDGAAPASDSRLVNIGVAAWHETTVDRPLEEIRQSLQPSARRAAASSARRGVDVRVCTGLDAVRQFHGMHVGLRKGKYGMLAQPADFFDRIWAEFCDSEGIFTLLACIDSEPVAGAMLLVWGDTLYFKFAASRLEALHLLPNYAVYWRTIQLASGLGLRRVDWGLSDLDQPGLVAFKRKWASGESRIHTLRTTTHTARQSSEMGSLLTGLTNLFADESVPDEITARAGSLLYRYFA